MVTERKEDIQKNLEVLKAVVDEWEMRMHFGKTKVMVVSKVEEGHNVTIDDEKIEEVQNLKYLGSIISTDGPSDEDIEQRIGAAPKVAGVMRKEVIERRVKEGNKTVGVYSNGSAYSSIRCETLDSEKEACT